MTESVQMTGEEESDTMAKKQEKDAAKRLLGQCFGCMHGVGDDPGEDGVCRLCTRNGAADRGAGLISDAGQRVVGLRDCYVSPARFDMDLRGETFFKSMTKRQT